MPARNAAPPTEATTGQPEDEQPGPVSYTHLDVYKRQVHLPATVVHRITARTTVLFVEASTAALGWQRDVVRLSDDYGRAGTNQT